MPMTHVKTELDRQTDTLVELGYADLAGVPDEELRAAAAALVQPLEEHDSFVLVVHPSRVPVSARVPLLALGVRKGTLSRHFADVDTFRDVVEVPDALVYAVTGVERGEEFCGVRPAEAAVTIAGRGRTMLTMAEGIAFLHAHPGRWRRTSASTPAPAGAATAGCQPSGSPTRPPISAGAGSTTTTPGSASRPPRRGSPGRALWSLPSATNLETCRFAAVRPSPRP